ncbi:MAG: cation:proton antiporter [Asticcacaulis sp.]
MFQIGMNFEFSHLKDTRTKKGLIPIAIVSIGIPFGLGLVVGHLSAPIFAAHINPTIYSLFCGVAMAITAVPVLGRILSEYGLNRQELGVLAISAAAINDVVGWLLLAGVSAIAMSNFAPTQMALQVGGVIIFGLACLFLLRPLSRWLLKTSRSRMARSAPP